MNNNDIWFLEEQAQGIGVARDDLCLPFNLKCQRKPGCSMQLSENPNFRFVLFDWRINAAVDTGIILVLLGEDGNPSRANIKQALRGKQCILLHLIWFVKHSAYTYYKHRDLRIKKAQEFKTKTSANSGIQDLPLRYQVYQGRLLASFLADAKYEHVGQDTRSQGGKDLKEKYLKISDQKTKSKDNDKGSRSKITKHEGTSLQQRQRPRSQELNDKSNLIDLMKECHNELTSGEIVSLKKY
nr:hypothetical protein [Tanacetum cinerariifolium]